MDMMQAIRSRRSIRAFLDRPVEEDKLLAVLEAGRLAPSARNMQDWKFIVVQDAAARRKLAAAARDQQFVGQAPVVIAACGTSDLVMTCGQPAYAIDVTIALDHMTLAATSLQLGTCWIGAFYEDKVKEILGVPPEIRVVALMPIGYPAQMPEPRPRKKLDEIVAREHW
ncbi:MAG: nitroreductase family protein [Methanothrix sp.]|nr:nitroreductase family protein [Methanothrix sp.]